MRRWRVTFARDTGEYAPLEVETDELERPVEDVIVEAVTEFLVPQLCPGHVYEVSVNASDRGHLGTGRVVGEVVPIVSFSFAELGDGE